MFVPDFRTVALAGLRMVSVSLRMSAGLREADTGLASGLVSGVISISSLKLDFNEGLE